MLCLRLRLLIYHLSVPICGSRALQVIPANDIPLYVAVVPHCAPLTPTDPFRLLPVLHGGWTPRITFASPSFCSLSPVLCFIRARLLAFKQTRQPNESPGRNLYISLSLRFSHRRLRPYPLLCSNAPHAIYTGFPARTDIPGLQTRSRRTLPMVAIGDDKSRPMLCCDAKQYMHFEA